MTFHKHFQCFILRVYIQKLIPIEFFFNLVYRYLTETWNSNEIHNKKLDTTKTAKAIPGRKKDQSSLILVSKIIYLSISCTF